MDDMVSGIIESTTKIVEENDVEAQAREKGYEPYVGGAGPDAEQARTNTEAFASLLKTLGISFKVVDGGNTYDTDPHMLLEFPDEEDVGYDRWGFTSSWTGEDMLDNSPLDYALEVVKKRYGKN